MANDKHCLLLAGVTRHLLCVHWNSKVTHEALLANGPYLPSVSTHVQIVSLMFTLISFGAKSKFQWLKMSAECINQIYFAS